MLAPMSRMPPSRTGKPGIAAFSRSRIMMCDLLATDTRVISLWYLHVNTDGVPGKLHASGRMALRLEPYSEICDQRQMVRRHQRLAGAGELEATDLDLSFVIDVIEMQNGEDARVGAAAFQMLVDIDALKE